MHWFKKYIQLEFLCENELSAKYLQRIDLVAWFSFRCTPLPSSAYSRSPYLHASLSSEELSSEVSIVGYSLAVKQEFSIQEKL